MIHNVPIQEVALPLVVIHDAIFQPLSHPFIVCLVGSGHGLIETEAIKFVLMPGKLMILLCHFVILRHQSFLTLCFLSTPTLT